MKAAIILGFLSIALSAPATIVTKHVTYKQGNTELEGYLAYDDSNTRSRPGIMVVHDWNGLDGYEEGRTRMLAELGYVAFAVDIYGKGIHPTTDKENGELAGKYKSDRPLYRARLQAGLDELKAQRFVDTSRIAAIGYCFGGTGVLELARSGADIKGIVSFHGGLDSDTNDAANIRCKVNIQHGELDPLSPLKQVNDLKKELDAAHVDYSVTLYANAVHAFTEKDAGNDPSKGVAYNELADKRSWTAMKAFFNELFGASH
jgi:dienelactone hydrolase